MASLLEQMPDIVLLNILSLLNIDDLINLSKCGNRFNDFCSEQLVVRHFSFESCYYIKEEYIKKLIEQRCRKIQSLNMNHCYWLTSRTISWIVGKCKELTELHVLECQIKIRNLVVLVSALPNLIHLSFSAQSFHDLKKEIFNPCASVLKGLKRIHIYYSSRELALMYYLGEHTTVLDHCHGLEELYIGSAGMAIPELYRPLVSKPNHFLNLRVMCITSNIHAGAQMLYYGTLSQLPNSNLKFRTLLMPNVNFPEFMRKAEYRDCLKHLEELEHLDIYGSKVTFPMEVIDIKRATKLRHLSLGASRITGVQLKYIASHCTKLTSINLFNCDNLFKGRPANQGLEALFVHCDNLRHLNVGGECHHLLDLAEDTSIIAHIKGLESLCVPTCMLFDGKSEGNRRTGKRVISCRGRGQPTKRRCLDQPSTSTASTDSTGSSPKADRSEEELSQPSTSMATVTRISHVTTESNPDSWLAKLVENNKDLKKLEIIAANMSSLIHQNKFISPSSKYFFEPCQETKLVRDIDCIHKLSKLESLTLMGIPGLVSGQGLAHIMQGCEALKTLHIGFVGSALAGSHFPQALKNMLGLLDLRIEAPQLPLKSSLFEALGQCHKLQRLCIIAKNGTFQAPDVVKLVDQLPQLICFQLFASGTISGCKNLVTTLNKKFKKSRPALSVAVSPVVNGIDLSSIPAKHLDEITRFCSRVAGLPPGIRV